MEEPNSSYQRLNSRFLERIWINRLITLDKNRNHCLESIKANLLKCTATYLLSFEPSEAEDQLQCSRTYWRLENDGQFPYKGRIVRGKLNDMSSLDLVDRIGRSCFWVTRKCISDLWQILKRKKKIITWLFHCQIKFVILLTVNHTIRIDVVKISMRSAKLGKLFAGMCAFCNEVHQLLFCFLACYFFQFNCLFLAKISVGYCWH